MSEVTLLLGDCLEILPILEAQSVDAFITDIPYGTTACSWDEVIPFEPMWAQVKRLLKPRGVFVTTASQPFTSKLVMSNLQWFRYETIWKKDKSTGHLDANRKPMKQHENVVIFSENGHNYNPQMTVKPTKDIRPILPRGKTDVYGTYKPDTPRNIPADASYPRSVIEFNMVNNGERQGHPTQKPVALYEYLIRTYTNEGDTVMDFCMGSGTTLVACLQTGRNGIGIEKEAKYFEIAERRIKEAQAQMRLPV